MCLHNCYFSTHRLTFIWGINNNGIKYLDHLNSGHPDFPHQDDQCNICYRPKLKLSINMLLLWFIADVATEWHLPRSGWPGLASIFKAFLKRDNISGLPNNLNTFFLLVLRIRICKTWQGAWPILRDFKRVIPWVVCLKVNRTSDF